MADAHKNLAKISLRSGVAQKGNKSGPYFFLVGANDDLYHIFFFLYYTTLAFPPFPLVLLSHLEEANHHPSFSPILVVVCVGG